MKKARLLIVCFVFFAASLYNALEAQTNPSAQSLPYSQNFGTTTFSSMPTGTAVWTVNSSPIGTQSNAESSTDNGNATVTATSSTQTTGGVYGYETSSNGMLYIQTSSNTTNGTSQLAVAINTTSNTNILVSYDIEMISAQSRTIGVELQYRVGTSGSWTAVSGTVYSHNSSDKSNGDVDHFTSISLPSAANNNSVVQLRWVTWRGSESGNSSGIAIDNISVTGTNSTNLIYRSVKNGNWSQLATWQGSTDSSTWSAVTTIPDYTSRTVTIQSGDTVTIDSSTTIDQVIVNGTLVYGDYSGSTITLHNGSGADLIINGTYEDFGPNSNTWSSGATWSMGSAGTLIRTKGTSSDDWRDNYQGGISSIPSTASWILWKNSSSTPVMSSTSAMYYPNLILKNTYSSTYGADGSEGFEGSSDYPRIKGYLDVGGTGTGSVVLNDSNTNSTPIPVDGKITVRSGSELRIGGTGMAAHKDVEIDGVLQYGSSGGRTLTFAGGINQTFSGSGTINIYNLTVNDSISTDTVFVTRAITVNNTLTLTKGVLDCEKHQLTNSANPAVSLSPSSSTICSGSPVALTAGNYTTYIWTPSTGLSATTGTSVNASPTSTTTYTVYGSTTNKYTCAVGTDVITTNPLPTLTVTPSSASYCAGGSSSLTASGANTYTWAPTTGLSVTTGATVTANPTASTTYTVSGTNTATGCVGTKTVVVTVNPLPTLTITPSSASICTGSSTSLTASGAGTGGTYSWAPTTGLSATTGATVTANPTTTKTYTVSGTNSNGCVNTQTVVVTVNPLPTISLSPSSASICTGSSTSLTASGAGTGGTYSWAPSTGLSATTGATVTANSTSTTTYTITGANSSGCVNTQTIVVTVNPLPSVSVSPTDTSIYTDSLVVVTASGADTYAWSPSAGLSATTGASDTARPTVTTTYTVAGTNSVTGCSNTATAIVEFNPLIISPDSGALVFPDSAVTLSVSGADSYTWSPSDHLSATTGSTVVATPVATTTYTVTGTISGSSHHFTRVVVVYVNPLPIPIFPPINTICAGGSVTLQGPPGASSYTWSPSGSLSASSGASVVASPTVTTTYTVKAVYILVLPHHLILHLAYYQTITVFVTTPPVVTVTPPATYVCIGTPVSLSASGAFTYTWAPSASLSANSGATVSANPTITTTYTVTGYTYPGCSATATSVLTVIPIEYATLTKQLDGSYYLTQCGDLYFRYDEEYVGDGTNLTFNIYDYTHTVLASSATTALTDVYKDNYYEINPLALNPSIHGGFFILEVINKKGEKYYLRFQN